MKESSGKTKKLSKGVRRARSMRNVVMMVLVCVLMLSAATYAWFTLSKNARVASLSMSVGEESSLMIAPDTDRKGTPGNYGNVLEFGSDLGTGVTTYKIKYALQPATVDTNQIVYSPDYDDTGLKVDGVNVVDEGNYMKDTSDNGSEKYYCYETTFYLKTAGKKPVNVQLQATKLDDTYTEPSTGGTYILNENAENHAAAAIRISLSDTSNNTIVYEPLSNDHYKSTDVVESAEDTRTTKKTIVTTSAQESNGSIPTQSTKLSVSPDGTRITMRIWLEGTDSECVNQIMGSDIAGQIAFEVVEEGQTP